MYGIFCLLVSNILCCAVVQSHYRPKVPRGFEEFKVPRLCDSGSRMVVRLSSLRTGRFYSQEILLVLISVRS